MSDQLFDGFEDTEQEVRPERDRAGRIITFYSYKGGTGRTMSLANTAWLLAANGYRVLVVDWDLEAPGLDRFFSPFLDQTALDASTGVIDLIHDYAERSEEEAFTPVEIAEAARVRPHVLSLSWPDFPHGGALDLLPAGQASSDFAVVVANTNWEDFYARRNGAQFFRALRADMARHYDYVLIDSRTGLSDIQEICTVEMPHDLVVCFTLSGQSIEGASRIATKVVERYARRDIRVLPVPMRIDDGEKGKADAGRVYARRAFANLPQGLVDAAREHYWDSVEIPYLPYYAYEEILAPFGDKPGTPTSMLSACERLVSALTDGRVTALPPMDEDVRLRYAERFARPRPAAREDVFVSYIAEDRMWAEWITWHLEQTGARVHPRELEEPVRSESERLRATASRTVAVWSPAYARAVQKRLARDVVGGELADQPVDLVTVRVGDSRPTGAHAAGVSVDLSRAEEDQAREQLLRAISPSGAESRGAVGDGPRFPGLRPAIWNVRLRNQSFTGRAAVLDRLRDQLREQQGGRSTVVLPTPQTLYGLGGVGKTQIALEYAHRFMADYDLVWWIEAEEPEQVAVSLTDLARRLELRVGENASENADLVKETLRLGTHPKARRWLLIFDNADDPANIVRYFPGGPGDVLVTSRNQSWSGQAQPLEVDIFQREESVDHLRRRVPELSTTDASLVAEAVGDLPLAVEIAAAWLETTGVPVGTYIEQLRTEAVNVLAAAEPADYPTTFGATWKVSIARLREQSPAAARLLQLWAFFAPDSISRSLVYNDQMIDSLVPYDEDLRDKYMMGKLLRALSRYGLARVDSTSSTFQVHRMVQAVVRAEMTAEDLENTVHEAHRILVGARPDEGDTDDPRNWPQFELIWPHLGPSNAEYCDEPDTRGLLIDRVRYLWKRGELDRAEDLGRRLDAAWTEKLGDDDKQTLQLRLQLGSVLRSQGRFAEGLALDEDTLARQRRVLRENHPQTLQTAGNVAADLRSLGRFREALEMDRKTYTTLVDELGEDDVITLRLANNLAVDLRFNGFYEEARILDEDTFNRRSIGQDGRNHPLTLSTKANLGEDLRALGRYQESIDLLSEFREEYPIPVPDLASLRYAKSLAVSLRRAGRQGEARRLTADTYNRFLEHYDSSLPDSLSCALNLAADHSAAGDKERARDTAQEVYRRYSELLGERHPFTLICANNVCIYLRDSGQVAESVRLGRHNQELLADVLGPDHPYTVCATLNLSNSYGDAKDQTRAEHFGRLALAGMERCYGLEHPDTGVAQVDLAITLRERQVLVEAQQLRDSAIEVLTRLLGEDHPTVANARAWRRMGRDLELVPA
ncbi:FxSxx-COOH system tetratricopeptide repeat protein [Streptacidiphilus sp. N1-10]|uniref:FxSxx-COOH system tetratricopeptide repeat protein n=1 Tax=Streptacidiphilus jeojiensis TaxID=3229225 RepID=A0ABV6XYI8_9ACTN